MGLPRCEYMWSWQKSVYQANDETLRFILICVSYVLPLCLVLRGLLSLGEHGELLYIQLIQAPVVSLHSYLSLHFPLSSEGCLCFILLWNGHTSARKKIYRKSYTTCDPALHGNYGNESSYWSCIMRACLSIWSGQTMAIMDTYLKSPVDDSCLAFVTHWFPL